MRQRNLITSFKNAFFGLFYCFRTQRNFRLHLLVTILVLVVSYFLRIEKTEVLFLFFAILLVLALEMVNTTIEAIIDLMTSEWQEKARLAKDIAAATILLAAVGAVVIGIIIFSPYILLITNH